MVEKDKIKLNYMSFKKKKHASCEGNVAVTKEVILTSEEVSNSSEYQETQVFSMDFGLSFGRS